MPDAGRWLRRPDHRHRGDQSEDARAIRVAVVTGGSSGIGAATARLLTERGWHCVLLARGRERLEAFAAEIEAEWEPCDVSERSEVDEIARRVAERHPALHLLVNNAGIPGRGSFFEVGPEQIEAVARTNYLGSVWCTRAFLPLLEAGAPSDLVNVVSVAGLVPSGASGPYSAAKHAQLAFSRAVTSELRERGVRVHTVCPGPVETPGFSQRKLLERPLTARLVIDPNEVAAAILRTLERGRTEVVVPSFLRVAGILQGLAPATLARLTARLRRPT